MARNMMRKTSKFLHEMASFGYLGAVSAFLVIHSVLPDPTVDLEGFVALRVAMGAIAKWILFPSLMAVLVSGLLSMIVVPSYQTAGWALAKLALGVVVFEGTLVAVQAPMRRAAERATAALAGEFPVEELGATLSNEWTSFWLIGGLALVNVVLAVWRPRFRSRAASTR